MVTATSVVEGAIVVGIGRATDDDATVEVVTEAETVVAFDTDLPGEQAETANNTMSQTQRDFTRTSQRRANRRAPGDQKRSSVAKDLGDGTDRRSRQRRQRAVLRPA